MPAKRLLFREAARDKVLKGATALADAIRITLGPKSKCVLIDKKWGVPLVCNDGVTIAKEIDLKDAEENLGARMIRQAAERTGDAVGDGTSTSAILAHGIYAEGVRNVAAGASAIDLKRGLDRGLKKVVEVLKSLSRSVASHKEKAQVATISAHNDPTIGELVADAVDKVGAEGVVSVEEAKGTETTLEVVEGMQFDRGFSSPYFINQPDKMSVVLDDPLILLYEKKIASLKDLVGILEQIAQAQKSLLIIAEEVEGEALATLVVNKLRGGLKVAAVKAPGFGDRRKAMLQDIAVLTGGTAISEDLGIKLENVTLNMLGKAKKVMIDKENTTIIQGAGKKADIEARVSQIKAQIEETTSDYDREKLQERLAGLHHRLEQRQQFLQSRQLLFVDEDVGILHLRPHLVGIGDEVGGDIAAVELHTFDHVELGLEALRLFHRDHAFVADLLHRLGEEAADLLVAVGRNRADLGDLVVRSDLLRVLFELLDHGLDRDVDAALEIHGVHAGGNGFGAFLDDRRGEHGRRRGAVTGDVGGLGCDLAHHLGAHILELVVEFDFLGDGDAVLGDTRRAERLVEHDVAALRAERHFHRIGENVDAA